MDTKDFVLGKFSKEERKLIDEAKEISTSIIDDYFIMDFNQLMNKYN